MEDTIAAISTSLGSGGIAIIRVSGTHALRIADDIFQSRQGKPSEFPTHTIHYGKINKNGVILDQVMLSVLRAPKTYTTEDTIEINCHGGVLTVQSILSLCLHLGARLAEPGEFTKRAFLNGRIDLTQAEAVMDLISAKTQKAQLSAVRALNGGIHQHIEALRQRIVNVLANVEAHLDFPEEDIETATRNMLLTNVEGSILIARQLLDTVREGRILRNGILVVIAGRPNVGKSSLMNAIIGRDRSIVTAVPGTTRDSVEETISVGGFLIRLTDTAGYRKARGAVEAIGIKRSINILQQADVVIHVIDISRRFSVLDLELASLLGNKPVIHVFSKTDSTHHITLPRHFKFDDAIRTSAISYQGIEELKGAIANLIKSNNTVATHMDVAVNERHSLALKQAVSSLIDAKEMFINEFGLEILSQQLRFTLNTIGEITGQTTSDDVLDKIFSTFCIGK